MFSPRPCHPLIAALMFATLLCAPRLTPSAQASGKKKRDPSIAIRFHAQTSGYDPEFAAKVKLGNPPQEITVEKIPSFSEHDFASFYPYRAADGTYSAVFKLDRHGEATLEELSTEKRGSLLVVVVNGRPLTTLLIDRRITDGIIFIPSGLTVENIQALGASFQIMNLPGAPQGARPAPDAAGKPTESELPDR